MNKEIEESRIHKKRVEALQAELSVLSESLRARGISYIFIVADTDNSTLFTTHFGRGSTLASMLTRIVHEITDGLVNKISNLSGKLKEMGAVEETWQDGGME